MFFLAENRQKPHPAHYGLHGLPGVAYSISVIKLPLSYEVIKQAEDPLRTYLAKLLPLLLAGSLAAAPSLTLEQAQELAAEHSPRVDAAEARALAARARHRQALGHLLPTLTVSEVFHRTTSPLEVFGTTLSREEFDPAIMAFPDRVNAPDALDTWITRVEATLPLYTGGRLSTGIRQAGLMARAGAEDERYTREDVRLETVQAWFDLARVREYVTLLERAEATTLAHVARARAFEEEGFLVRSEVLRAEVYLAEVRDLLNSAREGEGLALAALNLRMGQPQDTAWDLAGTPPLPPAPPALDSLVTRALGDRADLAAARMKTRVGQLERRACG